MVTSANVQGETSFNTSTSMLRNSNFRMNRVGRPLFRNEAEI
jgi:hypothetical protein